MASRSYVLGKRPLNCGPDGFTAFVGPAIRSADDFDICAKPEPVENCGTGFSHELPRSINCGVKFV